MLRANGLNPVFKCVEHPYYIFTCVLLTGRSPWVKGVGDWGNFAVSTGVSLVADASVAVDAVFAIRSILTQMPNAVVYVFSAVLTREARKTVASKTLSAIININKIATRKESRIL